MGTRHTSDATHLDLLALGILRRAGQLVMVRPADEAVGARWFVPGGLIEGGELAVEGLRRELREETGAEVIGICQLAFVSHIDRPVDHMQTIVFGFAIHDWQGELVAHDPDHEVGEVALVPIEEACQRLRANGGWPGIQEPLLAYLEEQAKPGTLWFYREGSEGQQQTNPPHDAG